MADTSTGQRIRMLAHHELDAEQQALLDAMTSGKRGTSANGGPFGVWLHNPRFGMPVQHFGAHVRYETSLPPAVSELLILACAAHWRAQYEWFVHAPIALEAGVPHPVVESIRLQKPIPPEYPEERRLVEFSRDLFETGRVGDDRFQVMHDRFSTAQIIEIAGVLGYYSLVAMTLNIFQVDVPDPDFLGVE